MSFSNYEQTVIINSVALSGVSNVDGSYGITETPIKVAGVGFIDALVDGPLEGSFSINRRMVSHDPLLAISSENKYIYDDSYISGAILFDNDTKGFGFTKGRITKYSASCSVGDLPEIQTDITVYGELGSGVMVEPATLAHPEIQFPSQGSISVSVSDFTVDTISDFNYSRSLNLLPVYAIPKGTSSDWVAGNQASYPNLDPVQVDTQYPIETDISFTMIVQEYQVQQMKDRFGSAKKTDVVIDIKDTSTNEMINSFTGKNVRLIGESTTASVDGEMSISLSYKGYETLHNPVS